MKILMITATYPPSTNGVAISTGRFVTELRRLGHQVWVLGPERIGIREASYFSLPTIRHVPFVPDDYPLVLPWIGWGTWQRLRRMRWDLIHVQHPNYVGLLALRFGKVCRAPVVFTYHTQYDLVLRLHLGWLPGFIQQMIYEVGTKRVLQKMSGLIATTTWLLQDLRRQFPGTPLFYVSTAGLPVPFALPGTKAYWRKFLGLPARGPLLLTVTRLSKEKNAEFLIRAFTAWAAAHPVGQFIIIGDGRDRSRLEALSHEQGMGHRIRFAGLVPNSKLAPWLNAADLFLYSSLTDTISVNLVEAMSAGLPVVALDDVTMRELIVYGQNGYLSPPDPETFANAIDHGMKRRERLSRKAAATASGYTLTSTTAKLLKVYHEVVRRFESGRS